MKIIDTNILNKFVKNEVKIDTFEIFYITEDLKDEIENLKSISIDFKERIRNLNFKDAPDYPHYNESLYLKNYQKLINRYNNIISFYGLKGLGDISILAFIATIILPANPTLFESQDKIEVITNDSNLKIALQKEFFGEIIIIDPLE